MCSNSIIVMLEKNLLEKEQNNFENSEIELSKDRNSFISSEIEKSEKNIRDITKRIIEIRASLGVLEPLTEIPPSLVFEYEKIEKLQNKLQELSPVIEVNQDINENNLDNQELKIKPLAIPPENLPI